MPLRLVDYSEAVPILGIIATFKPRKGIRRLGIFLGLCLAWSSALAATSKTADVSVNLVKRTDNLDWNIAGNAVNVLSELKWENLAISKLSIDATIRLPKDLRIVSQLGYGHINSGFNQDSDYDGNNRTLEFSRTNNKARGNVIDASVGLGKEFGFGQSGVYLTPAAGMSIHQQNLTMTDGVQVVSASSTAPPLGPLAGLNSSYKAQWAGPWWGLDARWSNSARWSFDAMFEYHLVEFSATANWNLRSDFAHPVSFTHRANGQGLVLSLRALYTLDANWTVKIDLSRQRWQTSAGTDLVYLADGSTGWARLNEVNWDSGAVGIGLVRRF
jgi:hypothetical protein